MNIYIYIYLATPPTAAYLLNHSFSCEKTNETIQLYKDMFNTSDIISTYFIISLVYLSFALAIDRMRLSLWLTDGLIDWLIDPLIDGMIDRFIHWLIDGWIDRLIGWPMYFSIAFLCRRSFKAIVLSVFFEISLISLFKSATFYIFKLISCSRDERFSFSRYGAISSALISFDSNVWPIFAIFRIFTVDLQDVDSPC